MMQQMTNDLGNYPDFIASFGNADFVQFIPGLCVTEMECYYFCSELLFIHLDYCLF
jgi:hypothetical protein